MSTIDPNPRPPTTQGPLQKRETRLAWSMLVPSFLVVAAIVLFPLLVNFWISVKPIKLGELRAPNALIKERVKGNLASVGDVANVEYRIRNSSRDKPIADVKLTDDIPLAYTIDTALSDSRCVRNNTKLHCAIGDLQGAERLRIKISVVAGTTWTSATPVLQASTPVTSGIADNILTNARFTLDNFRTLFDAGEFWSVLKVTFYYTTFGTVGALALGLFAALLLNSSFRGRGVLRGLFLFPYVAPVIAVAFTWVILLDPFSGSLNAILLQTGAINGAISFFGQRYATFTLFGLEFSLPLALSTVIAFESWRYFPLSFLFILARMQSINTDMYEAAEVDGASPLQQFWYISLPQLMGILSVLFLLRFIWTFNKFDDIFLLTGGAAGTRTLTVSVYEYAFAVSNLGAGAAVAVVVFFILFTFSMIYFRFTARDEGL